MSRSPLSLRHVLMIALAIVSLRAHAAVGDGFWHTDGNQIKDAAGNIVRFSGVNWHGMDSANLVPHGLWGQTDPARVHTIQDHLDEMKAAGFNLIRLAFSSEILIPGRKANPDAIDGHKNADLRAMTCLEILDRVVTLAGERGIRIILDYHRLSGGARSEDGHWYDSTHPESQWIANWKALALRYRNDPTVVGADLFNEVHGAVTWKGDGQDVANNWRWAAKRCANEILAVHPDLLICVQGLHSYNGQGGWWGAVHLGLKDFPLTVNVANRLVYEVHDYGPVIWDQPFHQAAAGFPGNLPTFWNHQWGFVHNDGIAPIWVGEWGSFLDLTQDQDKRDGNRIKDILVVLENEEDGDQHYAERGRREVAGWFPAMRDYIAAKQLSWTWWCWTPESRDTGGILTLDYTVNTAKVALLAPVTYPAFAPSGPGGGVPPANRAPTAAISGSPTGGPAPLVVAFSAAGSLDPDGDALNYAWTFGDGATASGVAPSHTFAVAGSFTVAVAVNDGHGHSSHATTTIVVTSGGGGGPVVGTGTGLLGTYFDNEDFTGTSVQRTDAVIDFDWGHGIPIAGIADDRFSVRWTGKIQAQYSETYTFTTTTDDGVRLWVDGVQLIDDWSSHGPLAQSGTITLTAGQKYAVKMDYFDGEQGALARLMWSSASTPAAIIPGSQIYPEAMTPPPGGGSAPGNEEETSGKCGVGGSLAALLLALALTLRLGRRSLV